MIHIFTYGSLMFDPVWSRVVTGKYESCEAILEGYDRKGLRDEVYPVIVPSAPHSQVHGILYRNVASSDLTALDRFEGEYYFRKAEQVMTFDRQLLPAETYVLKEEYYMLLSPKDWDPVYFSTTGIHIFIHSYRNFDKQ